MRAERIPVPYQDPDQYAREAGIEATGRLVDGCVPLRAALVAQAWGEGAPDPRFGERITMTERALLECAAWCLRAVMQVRRGELHEVESASEKLEREVIALAARGLVSAQRLDVLGLDAFTGPARLFAWTAALGACARFGRKASFASARRLVGMCTAFNAASGGELALPREVELELVRETLEELDDAEAVERPSIEAIGRLLAYQRAQRARAWIAPVLEAMDHGAPAVDTAARLREAANIFEGRT